MVPILVSPWIIKNLNVVSGGNGLYSFISIHDDEVNYAKKALDLTREDIERQTSCHRCKEALIPPLKENFSVVNLIMSYYFMTDKSFVYSELLDNASLKEYLLNVVLNPVFVGALFEAMFKSTLEYYNHFWRGFLYLPIILLAFYFFWDRRRDVWLFIIFSSLSIVVYFTVLFVFNFPFHRMFTPFLLFQWAGVALLIEYGLKLDKTAQRTRILPFDRMSHSLGELFFYRT